MKLQNIFTVKGIIRIILFTGTFISLFFVPWPILKASLSPLPKTIQAQVDKASAYGFDGIIVAIDRGGANPEYYVSGYKNRETKTPADHNSLFKIASVSKLYTALAITKLAMANKINLDANLGDYFPELKLYIEYADEITIAMMVRHRSGIPDYTKINNYWAHPKQSRAERLKIVLDLPAHFRPDTDYEYSNTNYLLLSMLIEKVSGMSKFAYIKKEILDPLNLQNTFGSIKDVDLDRVMSGYYVGYENDLKTDDNGVMLTTARDLCAFIRALNDGSVFKSKQEQTLYASLYEFEHTGLIPGYQTIAKYHPDIDAVIVQFTNTVNFDGYNWNLSEIMYKRILRIAKYF